MDLHCFAIYDDKAKAYLPPWFVPTLGMGQRAFVDAVNDPGTQFYKHPADYTLFFLGKWNQNSGQFKLESVMVNVANGMEVKADVLPLPIRSNGEVKEISRENA